ncbi:hypothetical protein BVZ80_01642B, partial [Haemophilus influenzae]
KTPASRNV